LIQSREELWDGGIFDYAGASLECAEVEGAIVGDGSRGGKG
jgi:hypothetical protein